MREKAVKVIEKILISLTLMGISMGFAGVFKEPIVGGLMGMMVGLTLLER